MDWEGVAQVLISAVVGAGVGAFGTGISDARKRRQDRRDRREAFYIRFVAMMNAIPTKMALARRSGDPDHMTQLFDEIHTLDAELDVFASAGVRDAGKEFWGLFHGDGPSYEHAELEAAIAPYRERILAVIRDELGS